MSKFMYFDFRCTECQHAFEGFVKPDGHPSCPECSGVTKRLISAPSIKLPGTDPSFPGEYSKWEKKRRTKAAADKKFYDNHGVDKMHHSCGS